MMADTVISNGVFNLCADKQGVFSEVMRVLKPGGVLQFADIANSKTGGRRQRSAILIFGRPELPVACRVQAGRKC